MLYFPNCKINLGLNIVSKRSDGYHDLETVFYPLEMKDALEVIQAEEFGFVVSGLPVEGDVDHNLCVKAYKLLKQDFPHLPTVSIHLHKAIPMGAGLGGGSSDGAFMLKLLNSKFRLNLSLEALSRYALQLGSDCPFFLINKPCFATGRGEIMEPVDVNLSTCKIVLINPGIHVSTKDAFKALTSSSPEMSIKEIIKQPVAEWKYNLVNDFEKTVFLQQPVVADIKNTLYEKGALYASMSGTGSTVFGIFDPSSLPVFQFPSNYLQVVI